MGAKMVNRIAEQRTKRGLTIAQLAEKCGISDQELEVMESADYAVEEMSAVKAAKVAEALGCLIKDLIYEDQ